MTDPVRLPIAPPLKVTQTIAGYQIIDAGGCALHLYTEDDAFRRGAVPHYWLGKDARAVACWVARALTDAIERGDVIAVNSLGLDR